MNIALWVVAALLTLAFLGAGAMKIGRPKEELAKSGLAWTEDFSAGQVKAIGAVEALGALGLVLPGVTGIAPILVPIAATGLAVAMAGAVLVHVRRKELPQAVPAAVLLVLAAFVAWGRFGPYPL
ncbi:DoxX family protein [Herbidospora sp. NEAU-GS84]|uniref:DoxX family protein n=1 Tax=Herbidospora solisilvae TaxID=2696284 RepID=A0A7C9N0J5_9ACTN|nr:DoxX family protein [Herbidospora solisilvae]NAS22269.1 DoxX family protein [Herbidospora solisilvae]